MQRSAKRSLLHAALLLVILWAPASQADDGRWLDLTWRAPAECPMGVELEQQIVRLVGTAPRDGHTLHATVDVVADDRGWHAHMATVYGGEAGERTFDGATCHAVARAVALLIALTVDSNVSPLNEEPAPPLPPTPTPPPPASRQSDSTSRPTRLIEATRGPTVKGLVTLGPRSVIGLLRHPGFGVEIAVGARFRGVSLEIAGAGYLPETTTLPNSNVGGRFQWFTLELRACPNLTHGPLEFFACASVGVGRLSADGFGVNSPGSAATTLGTLAVGPGIGFFLSAVHRLGIASDVSYTPGHARFVLDNIGPVHQVEHIGASVRIDGTWYW